MSNETPHSLPKGDKRKQAGTIVYSVTYEGDKDNRKGVVQFMVGNELVSLNEDHLLQMWRDSKSVSPEEMTIEDMIKREG